MVADFFTKPIQGTLFKQLQDRIMNIDSSSIYHSNHRSVLGETVINEENSNATSTVKNDDDTSKDVGTMSYKDAVVNKGWFACQIILYDLLGPIEKDN